MILRKNRSNMREGIAMTEGWREIEEREREPLVLYMSKRKEIFLG
jgi:cytidylate kinase